MHNLMNPLFRLRRAFFCVSLLCVGPSAAQTFFEDATAETIGLLPFTPGGIVFGDYNNDGWPDLFLAGAGGLGQGELFAFLRNQGDGHFAARIRHRSSLSSEQIFGDGAALADYDNDGDLDLFLTVGTIAFFGRDLLLRNDRGQFRNVTLAAGLLDSLPTENAIWLDYDRDGHLDLYVGHWIFGNDPELRNRLWRNLGDGTFADVTDQAGLNVQLHSTGGGSGHGMVAGDFNDDGWPDLYLGVWQGENRLFLNDRQGRFRDATTSEIGDPGRAFGVAVGDIDNDGDLDLFHASGANVDGALPQRSLMLMNLGAGIFLDVTEGLGLGNTYALEVTGPSLGDIDNDGDLDLVIGDPHFLFINQGDGTFENRTDQSGISQSSPLLSVPPAFGDYDGDGFLDLIFSAGKLYRNRGNDHHWLRVALVGTESNRSGIGTRLLATAGELTQMREIMGGNGFTQDELVAHFGLGRQEQVERLEIRWPSGQVEVLTDIAADQKIRVIEGQNRYHVVQPVLWNIPDTLATGSSWNLDRLVRPILFETDARIRRVSADLSALGGADRVELESMGDDFYGLQEQSLPVEGLNGLHTISLQIEQETSIGPHWSGLSRQIAVLPTADQPIFTDGLAADWQAEVDGGDTEVDWQHTDPVYEGTVSLGLQVPSFMRITFQPTELISPVGYVLRLAFRPGEINRAALLVLAVEIRGSGGQQSKSLSSLIDLAQPTWQVMEVPLDGNLIGDSLQSIRLASGVRGTYFLDDIRLVPTKPFSIPITAVLEDHQPVVPQSFALFQNYPNPFNSSTLIRFALPEAQQMELTIYNLAGQQVVTLVEGVRHAGTYAVNWDGQDDDGQALASGVYLYRLQAGEGKVETRNLLLLR